jgi:hypothetical protein
MPFKFEKLEIWRMANEMADNVHLITQNFPKEKMFSLTSQLKRAADSISLNMAATGQSNPEQVKFLGYIDQIKFDQFYYNLENLVVKIQAFKNSLK